MKNNALARKWMKALRSGDYAQTKHKLRSNTGYCCLGVLCDVSGKGKWETDMFGVARYVSNDGEYCSDITLPGFLKNGLGLSEKSFINGMEEDDEGALIGMNDSGNASFEEIADAIQLMILADAS